MATITIPRTIEEATAKLAGLGSLLTAKSWERAALVFAFTHNGQLRHGPEKVAEVRPTLGLVEFARLGIQGLRSDATVRRYRAAWQSAIDDGLAVPVEPGMKAELPAMEFPDNPRSDSGTIDSFRSKLRQDPTVLQDVVRNSPALAEDVIQQARIIAAAPKPRAFLNDEGEVRVNMNELIKDANKAARNDASAALHGIISNGHTLIANWTEEDFLERLDADDRRRMERDVEDVIRVLNKVLVLLERKASEVAS